MLTAIDSFKFFTMQSSSYNYLFSNEKVEIKSMQRLPKIHQYVVGEIHNQIDRSQSNCQQTLLKPRWTDDRFQSHGDPDGISTTPIFVIDHHGSHLIKAPTLRVLVDHRVIEIQWFEIDANLYVSKDGDTSAELDAEYELLFTNYWILAATLDASVAFSEDEEIGVGKGLVSTETGLRLSYDLIDRAFSPYVGVVHERKYGDSADLAEADGGGTEDWFAVIGARIAF